ncbi:helix-turn-helix domain-containing protein [Kitasatospora sp. NPDC056446]|uniref:helix-turn-helix domain-containing protein n=1 Tax=Kitasatospora sp. NPDC056446 TaxID=3345819 RepID=UPI0036C4D329
MRHDEHEDQDGGSPIGGRLARWRARRAVSVDELAVRTGISPGRLVDLEAGRDWVDRHRDLASLAGALRLDAADLTGQPYPPAGGEHVLVRAVAFQLRREISETGPAQQTGALEDLDARTELALTAEAAGDDHALARSLPGLIRLGDTVAATAPTAALQRAAELRVRGHVAAAGLLRRLGYRDLAWMLLHRARPTGPEPVPFLAEETRLLMDMGLPEIALARVERAHDSDADLTLRLLEAVANVTAGRREVAERLLQQAAGRARDARAHATVSAAHVVVAAEAGAADEAVDHARSADLDALDTAWRARVLVTAASAHARLGQDTTAAASLVLAESLAPLRVRLSPFARELLSVLPARIGDHEAAETVRRIVGRAAIR